MNTTQWPDEKEDVSIVETDSSQEVKDRDLARSHNETYCNNAKTLKLNHSTKLICGKPFNSHPTYSEGGPNNRFNDSISLSSRLKYQNTKGINWRDNNKNSQIYPSHERWKNIPNSQNFQNSSPANWRDQDDSCSYWDRCNRSPTSQNKSFYSENRSLSSPSRRLSLQEYKERRMLHEGPHSFNTHKSRNSYSNPISGSFYKKAEKRRNNLGSLESTSKSPSSVLDSKLTSPERRPSPLSSKTRKPDQNIDGHKGKKPITGGSAEKSNTKPLEEPVILTLSSSDEEEDSKENEANQSQDKILCEKEPSLLSFVDSDAAKGPQSRKFPICFGSLRSRVIRIGSYRYLPHNDEDILLLGECFKMSIRSIDGEEKVTISIPIVDVIKSLACFTRSEPLLLIYVKPKVAINIRKLLHMEDKNSFYFDPCSQEQSHRRIAFILTGIDDYTKDSFKRVFSVKSGQEPLFEEINEEEADKILMLSAPPQIQSIVKGSDAPAPASRTILIFPPSPSKGRITISIDDYLCLAEEQFLNDVIIDFYLKWLLLSKLSEIHRQRTHVFSTFFYKRLTFKPRNSRKCSSAEENSKLSHAERRHTRVKSWSKGVDIFEKDFIIVPINEKSHWFLAVVCFPGLDPPKRKDSDQCATMKEHQMQMRVRRKRSKPQSPVITDVEWSDRDEAEGDDDELDDFDDEQEPIAKKPKVEAIPSITPEEETAPTKVSRPNTVKQPCILIFDSLAGSSRSRIVATLREYLTVEHKNRKGFARVFNRDTMPGACPKVPQQMNYSDCGIYTLQYAESFFEKPLKDYSLPIRALVDWFETDIVRRKRESIAMLIQCLMKKANPGAEITLPELNVRVEPDEVRQQEAESPLSSPPRNPTSNSSALPAQESSSNLEICDFKPITELNPYQGKKINLNLSFKSSCLKKAQHPPSEDKCESERASVAPIAQDQESSASSQSESGDRSKQKNVLQTLADDYISSDSDDEIYKDAVSSPKSTTNSEASPHREEISVASDQPDLEICELINKGSPNQGENSSPNSTRDDCCSSKRDC